MESVELWSKEEIMAIEDGETGPRKVTECSLVMFKDLVAEGRL